MLRAGLGQGASPPVLQTMLGIEQSRLIRLLSLTKHITSMGRSKE